MKLLAFDTSSKALFVAILEDETLLAETTLTIKKNHSITLMPVIDFLMHQIDLTPKDLDRIVVAEGPGSYTGLRIAVAKMCIRDRLNWVKKFNLSQVLHVVLNWKQLLTLLKMDKFSWLKTLVSKMLTARKNLKTSLNLVNTGHHLEMRCV